MSCACATGAWKLELGRVDFHAPAANIDSSPVVSVVAIVFFGSLLTVAVAASNDYMATRRSCSQLAVLNSSMIAQSVTTPSD